MEFSKYVLFSKGHDGCIISPGIVDKSKDPSLYLTKIGSSKDIENEYKIYSSLPVEFDGIIYNKECYIHNFNQEDYSLDQTCLKRIEEKNNLSIIYDKMITIKRFFGTDLSKILYKKIDVKKKDIYYLLKNLLILYRCVEKLNSKYCIFHRDITSHNILYDITLKKICLVDFVQSKQYFPPKTRPHHLPEKDLSDIIDVTNSIIEFTNKTFGTDIKNINKMSDIEKNKKHIKFQLKHN
jgi:serine/threonine protein kinase